MKKLIMCVLCVICLAAAVFAQANKLKEYKITIKGSAPLVLVDGKRKVDIIAVYTDKNGKDIATTLLQSIAAVRVAADKNGNSIGTVLLSSGDIADFETFKKENPSAVFTLTIRSEGDTKLIPSSEVSFDETFLQ